jgi:hypothetical protein
MDIYLHIGLHKTATGTLQRQYFPACQDLNLMTTIIPDVKKIIEHITKKDPIYFNLEYTKKLIEKVFDEKKINLISNESLSGLPFAGIAEYGLDHRYAIINNLKTLFPDGKIILVLRRQDSLAKSFYREYLKSGGTRPIHRFYSIGKCGQSGLMSLDRFKFGPYIRYLKDIFNDNVCILLFEEFIRDTDNFFREITDYIGIKNNKIILRKENVTRLSDRGLEISRYLNFIFHSYLNPAGIIPPIRYKRNNEIRRINFIKIIHDNWPSRNKKKVLGRISKISNMIFERCKEDNKNLDNVYCLNLKKFGYY